MKPRDHPVPSGDVRMAHLLTQVLEHIGAQVIPLDVPPSRDGAGDEHVQHRQIQDFVALESQLVARLRPAEPALWLTYHNYHKAPDLLGPACSAALGIPYILAEASHAPPQAHGRWRRYFWRARAAIMAAHGHIVLNPEDIPGLTAVVPDFQRRHCVVRPFLERDFPTRSVTSRQPSSVLKLVSCAMMRPGAKLASYAVLAQALHRVGSRLRWRLDIIGAGPASAEVAALFAPFAEQVRWRGQLSGHALIEALRESTVLVWPGVRESYGLAALEARVQGLGTVVADRPGVRHMLGEAPDIVYCPEGEPHAFAEALMRYPQGAVGGSEDRGFEAAVAVLAPWLWSFLCDAKSYVAVQ